MNTQVVIVKQAVENVGLGFRWVYSEWSDGSLTRYYLKTTGNGNTEIGKSVSVNSTPLFLKWVNTKPKTNPV